MRDTSELEAAKAKRVNTEMADQVELEPMRRQQVHVDQFIVFSPSMGKTMKMT